MKARWRRWWLPQSVLSRSTRTTRGRLAFLITSDEEASAKNGTVKVVETLMARNERLDYCLVGEPSSTEVVGDVVKNGRRGSLTCNLTIHGVQGACRLSTHLADNPVHRAAPVLAELVNIEWDKGNEFFPPTSMQIANVQSGTGSNNVIPGDMFVQFNFRFSTELTDEMIKSRSDRPAGKIPAALQRGVVALRPAVPHRTGQAGGCGRQRD